MAQEGNRPAHEPTPTFTLVEDDAYLKAVASASDRLPPAEPSPGAGLRESVPSAGQVLAGKYRVERLVGQGGMGVVVAARHIHLDAPVAMKFMTAETAADHHLVARFLREAQATARLRGEHVVRVSDIGELASGAPYMVMEFLQGQDLSALLTSLGPPPIPSAVEYAVQACEGLDEAHRAGLVHRDVKPSNLFLTRRPNGTACIKVVDFGISKSVALTDPAGMLHATSTRAVFGSPLYMAPEQMRAARDVDGRADLWSLGATLYELLSGSVPFAAESLVDLAYRIANEHPPSLRAQRPEVPYELERIVFRCLEKDRDRRFPDARTLADALEPFRNARPAEVASADDEEETRMVDASIVGGGRVPAAVDGAQSVPSIDTVSLTAFEQVSLPPAPGSAIEPDESLSTSSVSWGTSQRLVRSRSRALVYWAALGTTAVVALAVAGGLLFNGQEAPVQPSTASLPPPPAPVPVAPSSATLVPLAEPAEPRPPSTEPRVEPRDEVRTVSVMDLPAAPVPVAFVAPLVSLAASAGPPPSSALPARDLGIPKAIAAFAAPTPPALHAASVASPPHAAPNCSPPFFYDELGLKIFKPECVN